jgi:hypothetical protein
MSAGVSVSVAGQLAEHEEVIRRGLATFVEVGNALATIRDERLYRESHETFEDYCREAWGFARNYANKMIAASEAVAAVESVDTTVPTITSERQAREVAAIIRNEGPERAAEVLQEVADAGPVTAKAIRETARPTKTVTIVEEVTVDAETGEIVDPRRERLDAASEALDATMADVEPANVTPIKPHRRPLGDAMRDATHDLIKSAERVERLTQDDRWKRNAQQVGDITRRDLLRAQEVLTRALNACTSN